LTPQGIKRLENSRLADELSGWHLVQDKIELAC